MFSDDTFPDGAAVDTGASSAPPLRKRPVSAGFGSPGDDATVHRINLNDALIRHPEATFVMRAAGNAMQAAGIADGDVLLVDRALAPVNGSIVIAVVDGELLCRLLRWENGVPGLRLAGAQTGSADPATPLEIWGVVTTTIRSLLG